MPSQKIKFKMSMKELSFEFEGDIETGQRIQSGIQNTLKNLSENPTRVLTAEPEPITVDAKPIGTNGKRPKGSRKARPKSNTARALIVGLKAEGFFDEKRDIAAIRAALTRKGHNFGSNEVSAVLTPLVQKGVLTRDKTDGSNFEYERGPNDDDAGTADDAE